MYSCARRAGASAEGRDVASALKVFRHLASSVLAAPPASSTPASSSSSSPPPSLGGGAGLLEVLPTEDTSAVRKILAGLDDSIKIARKVQNCTAQGGGAQALHSLLKTLRAHLLCLQPGAFLLIPIGLNFEDRQAHTFSKVLCMVPLESNVARPLTFQNVRTGQSARDRRHASVGV